MKCFCAKAPAPNKNNDNVAALIAANFFFDFNILLISFEDLRQLLPIEFVKLPDLFENGDAWERNQPQLM